MCCVIGALMRVCRFMCCVCVCGDFLSVGYPSPCACRYCSAESEESGSQGSTPLGYAGAYVVERTRGRARASDARVDGEKEPRGRARASDARVDREHVPRGGASGSGARVDLALRHISETTRLRRSPYPVFCLKTQINHP